jgi:hypothetical protein
MTKMLSHALVVLLLAMPTVAAQVQKVTMDDFVGTWNIEVMSHQVALVIDKQDATTATATMMMMGRDVPLKGELVDRTITFTGVKDPNAPAAAATPQHDGAQGGHAPPARPIIVTLQEDGTLTGEMMTNNGPVKWTGEKLRARKKQP